MLDFKRIIIVLIIIILIAGVISGIYFYIKNNKKEENNIIEYTPQEEISEEQMRNTMVSLYFKSDNQVIPEIRLVDAKKLLENPYEEILLMLIEGPKNENLKTTIPEGTKINKIQKQGENLIIDFSEEFVSNHVGGENEEKLTINSIVNTLTELTEINGIKILIKGEENKQFKDGKIKFNKIFEREENI